MQLSLQQRFLLDIIKRLGSVRRDQLYLLAAKNLSRPAWEIGRRHVDIMLNQLQYCTNDVHIEGELVRYSLTVPCQERLEAVDVMLELTEGSPQDFRLEQSDCLLLRFILKSEGKLRLFGVARYIEDEAFLLPELSVRRAERIVFLISEKSGLPNGLTLPYRHFFALREENGTHRFFSSGDQ